jgi:hypothetical protein
MKAQGLESSASGGAERCKPIQAEKGERPGGLRRPADATGQFAGALIRGLGGLRRTISLLSPSPL